MALQTIIIAALMASNAVLALPQPVDLPQQTRRDVEPLSRRGGGAWEWSAVNKVMEEAAQDTPGSEPLHRRGGGAWTWSAANRVIDEATEDCHGGCQ